VGRVEPWLGACRGVWDARIRGVTPDAVAQGPPAIEVHRPFRWGVLWIADSKSTLPELKAGQLFASTASAVAVSVRHAQDVDFDEQSAEAATPVFAVTLLAYVGHGAGGPVQFDGEIKVSSGRATIGDIDREDALELAAGRWRLQVAITPAINAERFEIWFSPLPVR